MGCFNAKPVDKNNNTKAIEDQLRTGHQDDSCVHKLLLLGAGESGKSTLFKQMITLYGIGFSEKDKQTYIPIIFRNILSCIEELARQSLELSKRDEFARCKVQNPKAQAALQFVTELKSDDGALTPEVVENVKVLWADPGIQATYALRSKFQLNDSAQFFFKQNRRRFSTRLCPHRARSSPCSSSHHGNHRE
jgi:hypothetical protein